MTDAPQRINCGKGREGLAAHGMTLACPRNASVVESVLIDGHSTRTAAAKLSVNQSTVVRVIAKFKVDVAYTLGKFFDELTPEGRIDITRQLIENAAKVRGRLAA